MASAYTITPSALREANGSPEEHDLSTANFLGLSPAPGHSSHSPMLSHGSSDTITSPHMDQFDPISSPEQTSNFEAFSGSDPFFGVNFNTVEPNGPSFLGDFDQSLKSNAQNTNTDDYPLTPGHTASIHTTTPRSEMRAPTQGQDRSASNSVSPQELQKQFTSPYNAGESSQLTPSLSSSGRTSEDDLGPASVNMPPKSPQVMVSMWGHDGNSPTHAITRSFDNTAANVRSGAIADAGDLISPGHNDSFAQQRPRSRSRGGLAPKERPTEEGASINEIMAERAAEKRDGHIDQWRQHLGQNDEVRDTTPDEISALEQPRESNDNIPLGHQTENKFVDGQTYYSPTGEGMSQEDYDIIAANRNWANAPVMHPIQAGEPGRHQPATSQAAIERWQNLQQHDNISLLSRAATWGTRRRSLPSILDADVEGVVSGNFLKKLTLKTGSGDSKSSRPGSFFQELRGLVRRPSEAASNVLKRTRSRSRSRSESKAQQPDSPDPEDQATRGRGDGSPLLSLPTRSDSGRQKGTPSINTALFSIAHNAASIGTTHTRKGSFTGGAMTGSPTKSNSLAVKNTLRKRSKSEVPKPTLTTPPIDTHRNSVDTWATPSHPALTPSYPKTTVDMDDDDDDDDDLNDDIDLKGDANLIDGITPNQAGFLEHVLRLNPSLTTQSYLATRIAYQQVQRYKALLQNAVTHAKQGAGCPCGPQFCLQLGGSAKVSDSKNETRGQDPLAGLLPGDDETGPNDGAINADSFPADIPQPPTRHLPAEFECQLCFTKKKFQKPSDWTKHVHEDVAPFTCTWDKCQDNKMFKRKADWVRHENEGHRHLEWWRCNVDDCKHICYRRDNFLQHLVREHKYQEPKIKTKAAMKKAGGSDPTWQKVEQCHYETMQRTHEEPCRFCGKTFPTWKKLTVHLAKHMEQISLPILRLVGLKVQEINADTIISPIEGPPPRANFSSAQHTPVGTPFPNMNQQQVVYGTPSVGFPNSGGMSFSNMNEQFQSTYLSPNPQQFGNMNHHTPMMQSLSNPYPLSNSMADIPVTSSPYSQEGNSFLSTAGDSQGANLGGMSFGSHPGESFGGPLNGNLNGLGLQDLNGAPMGGMHIGYDNGLMNPSSGLNSPFSGQASPYQNSPHLNNDQQNRAWGNGRQQQGFM